MNNLNLKVNAYFPVDVEAGSPATFQNLNFCYNGTSSLIKDKLML